jgi:hypothetical protein
MPKDFFYSGMEIGLHQNMVCVNRFDREIEPLDWRNLGLFLKLAVYKILNLRYKPGYLVTGPENTWQIFFEMYWNDLPLLDDMITRFTIPRPEH